jgi:O-antigen ligase
MIKPDLRKHEHALIWLLVSYLWAGILLSGGRGIVLSLLISTLLTAWWLRAFRYEWLRRSLIGFLGGLAFYGLINLSLFLISGSFLTDNNGISRLIENTGSSGRIDIWLSALQQAISHPFFGLGGMHFSWFSETGFAVAHPHNIVLQLLVEWGIPFTLILVTVAGLALLKWMKRLKQQQCDTPNQWFYFAISNAFITGNLHSLVSGTWVMPISQLSLTVVTAFMLAHYQTEKTINSKIKTSSQYLLTTFSIIILALLIYGITPELKDFNNWLLSSLEEVGSTRFAPRFWVQGLIPQPI